MNRKATIKGIRPNQLLGGRWSILTDDELNGEEVNDVTGTFQIRLNDEISRITEKYGLKSKKEGFTFWCIDQISPGLGVGKIEAALEVDGSTSGNLNAMWFDDEACDRKNSIPGTLFLAKSYCLAGSSDSLEFGSKDVNDIEAAFDEFLNEDGEGVGIHYPEIQEQYQNYKDRSYPIKFIILVPRKASPKLKERILEREKKITSLVGKQISLELYDIERLQSLYSDRLLTFDMPIPSEVLFKIKDQGRGVKRGNFGKSLIAEVPLNEIFELVNRHGLSLFAKNLRVPIISSSYNEGMKRVLEDRKECKHFWFYNNGLTAICDSYNEAGLDSDPDDLLTISAKRMQIVNGCQTCFTIYYTMKGNKSIDDFKIKLADSSVLLRLIETGSEAREPREFAHRVARYTNSQTPISPRDLRATDQEQSHLREVFSRDWRYFFEVKKDEFRRRYEIDPGIKNNFDKPHSFSNEEAGQAFVAFWQNEPVFAKSSKRKIFENDTRYYSVFGSKIPPEAILLSAQMSYLQDEWRKDKGYKLRENRERKWQFSKPEVVRHAALYMVCIVGASLKNKWNAKSPSGVPRQVLRASCLNLKEMIKHPSPTQRDSTYHLSKELYKAFDEALMIVYEYSKKKHEEEPEESIRNLLIRPSTWADISTIHDKEIVALAEPIASMLASK